MTIDWVRLGRDLRADRHRRGLSQEEFARELSIRQSDLSLLERGVKVRPGPDIMEKIGRYLDAARPLQSSATGSPTLPAPDEESLTDPTFRQVWAQLGAIWKYRKTTTRKQWDALVRNIDTFHEPVEHATRAAKKRRRATNTVNRTVSE
jgi:transcriptional regulator with XRE-family HTH domain